MAIQLGSAYGRVTLDANGVVNGVQTANRSLRELINTGSVVGNNFRALGGSLQSFGSSMTAMFTLPIALAGAKAFQVVKDFDKSLNVLQAVAGATNEEMERMTDLARQLGADLTLPGTSAADAAAAMAELAKAGLSVNDIMSAARGVLQLSAAGQIENARAAEITANSLNAFKLPGTDAVRIADLLAAAANSSSAEVKELADSLQMSAAVASMSGMKIEELITDLGLMANAGIQGSDAGTSVKQMLLALQTPTNKAKELMQDLGISVYDAAGNLKSMRELIQVFSNQLGGLTMEQRNAALGIIFGSDAIRAANILLMQGTEAYDKMSVSVNNVGAASRLAAALMKGLPGVIENIKSSFETASIAALEPFKDDIIAIGGAIAKILNAFSNLPEPVRKAIVIFLLFIAVMGPILVGLGMLISMVGSVINAFAILGSLGVSLPAIGAVITGVVIPAVAALGAALLPILAVLAAVILFIGLFAVAWKFNFLGIRDNVTAFVSIIKSLWRAFMAFLHGDTDAALGYLKEAFQKWVDHINAVFEKVFGIKDAWGRFMEFLRAALGSAVTYISNVFSKTDWSQLGKFITFGIANGMLFGIPSLVLAASKVAESALAAIKKKLDIASPSGVFEQLGRYSAQGYQLGLARAMSADAIAQTMARPAQNLSNTQQQNITMQFASGLTIRQVQGMIAENNEALIGQLSHALGGA